MSQIYYYTTDDVTSILRGKLMGIKANHVYLVHGKGSYFSCGAASIMRDLCEELQLQVTEFVDFSVNPKDEEAHQGLQILQDTKM